MRPLILAMPGNEAMADALSTALEAPLGGLNLRRFPDGESYVRIGNPVSGSEVILVCTLARPVDKFLPLTFVSATARDHGASRVGLVCPYLPYMRQDKRFHEGEGVTSLYFAAAISCSFDWIVTVDPHLHRRRSLSEIYEVPVAVAHAAALLADWIRGNVSSPVIVGPDEESAQWVGAVAAAAGARYLVLKKHRSGDWQVEISRIRTTDRDLGTPVLLDDIISTGRTMAEAVKQLREAGYPPPYCVAVHGIFADRADDELIQGGATAIVTCNTIPHPTNAIDVSGILAAAARQLL